MNLDDNHEIELKYLGIYEVIKEVSDELGISKDVSFDKQISNKLGWQLIWMPDVQEYIKIIKQVSNELG